MATIGGMKTSYESRKEFAGNLQEIFARLEDLNRSTPMTEGEFIVFSGLF